MASTPEKREAEVWLRRVLNTEDPTAAPEPGSKEFNRVREEAARRIADARRRAEERARGGPKSALRGDPPDQSAHQKIPTQSLSTKAWQSRQQSASLADACAYNDGLWAGVPPDVLGPPPGPQQGSPPPSSKVPAKPIHPASSDADEWGKLCPGQLGRALPYPAFQTKPPAPEEETADPDEGLEEIVVDEVPPEFRERSPGVPPATAAVPAQEEERDENGRYVYLGTMVAIVDQLQTVPYAEAAALRLCLQATVGDVVFATDASYVFQRARQDIWNDSSERCVKVLKVKSYLSKEAFLHKFGHEHLWMHKANAVADELCSDLANTLVHANTDIIHRWVDERARKLLVWQVDVLHSVQDQMPKRPKKPKAAHGRKLAFFKSLL